MHHLGCISLTITIRRFGYQQLYTNKDTFYLFIWFKMSYSTFIIIILQHIK